MVTENGLRKYSGTATFFAFALGIVVLIGWWFHRPTLVQVLPNLVPMQFNTALLFVVASLGLFCSLISYNGCKVVLALFLGVFALLTLSQYMFGWDLSIDELFQKAYITTKSSNPGRMAPNTAIGFIFISLGLLSLKTKNSWASSCFGGFAFAFGFVSTLGYIESFEAAYGWEALTDMALHTSIGFILLGSALFIATVNFDAKAKISSWVYIPLMLTAFTVCLLFWRGLEVARLQAFNAGVPFHVNYTITILMCLFLVLTVLLLRKTTAFVCELEDAKFEAEVNTQMKTKVLHYVSHEIKSPLSAILGFSELYFDDENIEGEVKKAFDCIYTASMHLKAVIDDLLALSRFESGKIELDNHEYNIAQWAQSISKPLQMRANKQAIHFALHLAPNLPETLRGDASKLAQVVINLSENAFKFTPQDGEVNVYIELEDPDTTTPILLIRAVDNGRGIAPDAMEMIFEPFSQERSADIKIGLGLGLSICKRYLEMMNGKISVSSKEGEGTTFECRVLAYL
ncbi:MAG: Sensor histidine kinase RcsC [Chlamydiia bacterium]|nr:Sensor histidine kinase RcsC [Chlamydiia bacterium]MCH9614933.1 Sensor histidine kinase RcsC [Chlamydiia bacterium]MCH9629880.1 Sensor histidine kinase RcsC [Chlamydiia bacterium]